MPQLLLAYLITMVTFFIIDYIWITRVAFTFYRTHLGPLLLDEFRVGVAAAFYLVYIAGIVFFAVRPGLSGQSVSLAALHGALFGFFCYATYNFTNLATLKGYSATVVAVDLTWGTLMTGTTALVATWLTRLLTSS